MSRSNWKTKVFNVNLILKCAKKELSFVEKNIFSRTSSIPASLINTVVSIHNGSLFKNLLITREKVGFKFGDFVHTRKKHIFKKKFIEKKKIKSKN